MHAQNTEQILKINNSVEWAQLVNEEWYLKQVIISGLT